MYSKKLAESRSQRRRAEIMCVCVCKVAKNVCQAIHTHECAYMCVLNYTHSPTHTHAVAIEWAQVDMRSTIATIKIDICIKPNTHTDSTHTLTHTSVLRVELC